MGASSPSCAFSMRKARARTACAVGPLHDVSSDGGERESSCPHIPPLMITTDGERMLTMFAMPMPR